MGPDWNGGWRNPAFSGIGGLQAIAIHFGLRQLSCPLQVAVKQIPLRQIETAWDQQKSGATRRIMVIP